jgi:hypothetical protein
MTAFQLHNLLDLVLNLCIDTWYVQGKVIARNWSCGGERMVHAAVTFRLIGRQSDMALHSIAQMNAKDYAPLS